MKRITGIVVCALALLAIAGCGVLPPGLGTPELPDMQSSSVAPVVQTAEDDFSVADAAAATYEQRYYYNQLDSVRQYQYRMLYKALMAHADKAVFSGSYDDVMQDVAWSVYFDCPEFFYARRGGMYEGYDWKTDYTIEYVYDDAEAFARRAQVAEQVPVALQTVASMAGVDPAVVPQTMLLDGTSSGQPMPALDGYTARQLAWAVDEYLANSVTYHWDAAEVDDEEFYRTYFDTNTIYGALVQKNAICGGYSQAYAFLCYQMGIPCVYVEGEIASEQYNGAHAWDLVQIDGQWGVVDPTWSDDERGVGLRDDYFMSSDAYHNQDVTEFYVPADIPAA